MCVPQLFLRREQQVDKQFKADETATPPATGICVLCSYVSACYYVYLLYMCPHNNIYSTCYYICVRMLLYMAMAYAGVPTDPSDVC